LVVGHGTSAFPITIPTSSMLLVGQTPLKFVTLRTATYLKEQAPVNQNMLQQADIASSKKQQRKLADWHFRARKPKHLRNC